MNASQETREAWEEFLESIKHKEPELHNVCCPSCIYRCGCPEFQSCGLFEKFATMCSKEELLDIQSRYKIYQELKENWR